MHRLANDSLILSVSDDGMSIAVQDRRRSARWELDATTWGFSARPMRRGEYSPLTPYGPGAAHKASERELTVTYPAPGGSVAYTWVLLPDGLEVRLLVQSTEVARASLPGHFVPQGGGHQLLLPRKQGLLLRDGGPPYDRRVPIGSDISLYMYGCLGRSGGMLMVAEDPTDVHLLYGKRDAGLYCLLEATACEVDGWYQRRARLLLTDASVTAVCKRHRARLIERGDFVPWERKIERKPPLTKLFGSLIAFIGYNRGRNTDYVESARALREFGFPTVFYYPVRFNAMVLDFQMGGDPPVWLSDDEMAAMREAGGVLAPWGWTFEALDDGSQQVRAAFRSDREGRCIPNWRIDDFVWNLVCTPYQARFAREQYKGDMAAMGWIHYDVNAIFGPRPCYRTDHQEHRGRPMTARQDLVHIGRLLGPDTNGDRVVSSEGFDEFCTRFYDMGSNKYQPVPANPYHVPVPMTMLVFHDSTVHNWWELHTYNQTPFGGLTSDGMGCVGSGHPEAKAAMDALYGCPPLVFPFGRQYGWADWATHRTFSFEVSLRDAEVRRALAAALPVARLHRRIGMCELLSFDFLSDDMLVQATRFSDGTRVIANFSGMERDTDLGLLPPCSWRAELGPQP